MDMLTGRIDQCTNGKVVGWALISDRLEQRLRIELLIDDEPFLQVVADQFRGDLEGAGMGDGRYGFEVAVPVKYRDGAVHVLAARECAAGQLIGSPVEFFSEAAQEAAVIPDELKADASLPAEPNILAGGTFIDGFLDTCLPDGVVGWAARRDGSDAPVVVELLAVTDAEFDASVVLDDTEEGPDAVRVFLTPESARQFATRSNRVISAGRPPCPLCEEPLDPEGHICARTNGYRRSALLGSNDEPEE